MSRPRSRPRSRKKPTPSAHRRTPVSQRALRRPADRARKMPADLQALLLHKAEPDSPGSPEATKPDGDLTDKLLLEFLFKQRTNPLLGRQDCPVQSIPFELGLRVTNYGDTPFLGGTISSVALTHKETNIEIAFSRQAAIPLLNPREATALWLETTVSQFQGPLWLSCKLRPNHPTRTITTMQRTFGTQEVDTYRAPNAWGKVIYIQPRMELLQTRTNLLILILTLIVLFESLFGLETMLNAALGAVITVLSEVAAFLASVVR